MIRCCVKASLPEQEFAIIQQICNEDLAGRTCRTSRGASWSASWVRETEDDTLAGQVFRQSEVKKKEGDMSESQNIEWKETWRDEYLK